MFISWKSQTDFLWWWVICYLDHITQLQNPSQQTLICSQAAVVWTNQGQLLSATAARFRYNYDDFITEQQRQPLKCKSVGGDAAAASDHKRSSSREEKKTFLCGKDVSLLLLMSSSTSISRLLHHMAVEVIGWNWSAIDGDDRWFIQSPAKYPLRLHSLFQTVSERSFPDGSV